MSQRLSEQLQSSGTIFKSWIVTIWIKNQELLHLSKTNLYKWKGIVHVLYRNYWNDRDLPWNFHIPQEAGLASLLWPFNCNAFFVRITCPKKEKYWPRNWPGFSNEAEFLPRYVAFVDRLSTVISSLSWSQRSSYFQFIGASTEVSTWRNRHLPWEKPSTAASTSMIPPRPSRPWWQLALELNETSVVKLSEMLVALTASLYRLEHPRSKASAMDRSEAGQVFTSSWSAGCKFDVSVSLLQQ